MMGWMVSLVMFICLSLQLLQPTLVSEPSPVRQNVFACNVTVDAGPEVAICDPGGNVTLMGSVTGTPLFTEWTPSTGLSNPSILTPVADVTGTITYTLTALAVDPASPNLVVNGDFELGNTGFTSDYTYVVDLPGVQNEMEPQETYTVINDPSLVHYAWAACNDHTPSGVNMLLLNGSSSPLNVWCQTVSVTPNSWFNIAAWVTSVHPTSPAIIRFSINGTQIGPIVNATSATCQWIPFNALWYSGSSTSATICILNLNTAVFGNDFALDDISMTELCAVEDEVTITVVEEDIPPPQILGPTILCAGELAVYYADHPPDPEILSYEWTVSSEGSIISGHGSPQITVQWDDHGEAEICLSIESECGMNESCLEITLNDIPELPFITGPSALCPGDDAIFYVPELNPDDLYQWITTPHVNIISGEGTNEIDVEWISEGEAEICVIVTNECGSNENCIELTLYPEYFTLFDTVLCVGTTMIINGNTYGNGVWSGIEHFTDANGCDSLVEIEITEAASLEFMVTKHLCPGDSLFVQGAYQTEEGLYTDLYSTSSGCDSLVITEIIHSLPDTTWITSATCIESEAGTTITIFNNGLCDSTVIEQVILIEPDSTFLSLTSCSPADTGQVLQHLTNQSGCDSIIVTNTIFLASDITLISDGTCELLQVGVFSDTLINLVGCDSIVITTRFFSESDTTILFNLTCSYADTGSTSVLFINNSGCDSLVINQNIYAGSDTTFLLTSSCNPQDTGYTITNLTNQFGCDSIVSVYFSLLDSDTTYLTQSSCEPADTGTVVQSLFNISGCDSIIVTTTTLDPPDLCTIQALLTVQQPLCYGDSAIVNIEILEGLGPFTLTWYIDDVTDNQEYPSTGSYSLKFDFGTTIKILLESSNGLTLLDTLYIDFPDPLLINVNLVSQHNGFGVPCNGDTTGEVNVQVISGGTPPLLFEWSTGDQNQTASNLPAGNYFITVTDDNGCSAIDEIIITEPFLMEFESVVNDITCFGLSNGSIRLSNLVGGISPWMTSLDGSPFQPILIYTGLQEGLHNLIIRDANGCSFEQEFLISEPEPWSIDLGQDTALAYGSSLMINPDIIGNPSGDLNLSWSDHQCDDCLTRTIEITSNTTLHLTAIDENGCTSEDAITINFFLDRDLYIPNVFSPNGDGINDYFIIYSGSLLEIEELVIFDRWGDLLFQNFHFQPNEAASSWDGYSYGQALNPGVFAYNAIVRFKDGTRAVKYGDVTLVR